MNRSSAPSRPRRGRFVPHAGRALAFAAGCTLASVASAQAAPSSTPASSAATAEAAVDALARWELQDLGVRPVDRLHAGPVRGPTPNAIPGGRVITSAELLDLLRNATGARVLLLDVLGGPQTVPGAIPLVDAREPGSFDDARQRRLGEMLARLTAGNAQTPLVFFCEGPQSWMSYNAALRAIALGYTEVVWYRGGLEAWRRAGLTTAVSSVPVQGARGASPGAGDITAPGYPPGAYPPGAYPPGAYPPGAYPPNAYPPGVQPPNAYPTPRINDLAPRDTGVPMPSMPMPSMPTPTMPAPLIPTPVR